MTALVRRQLADLAAFMSTLKARVKVAVAGELSRAVGDAVKEVVGAVLAGRVPVPTRPGPRGPWADRDDGWGRPRDPWADGHDDENDDDREAAVDRAASSPPGTRVTVAVAAGAAVARWWAGRSGAGVLAPAGVGLGVGLVGLLGGTLARAAVAVLAAAADILAAADTLGTGAARLDDL